MTTEAKKFIEDYSRLSEDVFYYFKSNRELTKEERWTIKCNGIRFLKLIGVSLKRTPTAGARE